MSTVSSHRAKLASYSAGRPAPSTLQHSLMIALTTLELRFFYHQSSAKLQQPYLCLVQLSLFPLKAQISDVRDIRVRNVHSHSCSTMLGVAAATPHCRCSVQWGRLQETAATSDLQLEFCENVQRKLKISSLLLPRILAVMAGPEEVSRAEWAERGGEDIRGEM